MDIVDELREYELAEYVTLEVKLAMNRAAAEIESLRADNERKDKQLEKSEREYQSLRAELAEAKADTVLLDKLQSNMKKAWPKKTRVAINSSGYFEVSGAKGCYYDLREALSAMQEGK